MSVFYGGVDPGMSGAIAFICRGGERLDIIDMPVVAGQVSFGALIEKLEPYRAVDTMIYVENVHAMPKQGVSSTFKFGMGFGGVLGVLAARAFPYTRIEPSVWKRAVGLPAGAPKELSVKRAMEVFPQHARLFVRPKLRGTGVIALDGRAEAALIAWHCYQECQ